MRTHENEVVSGDRFEFGANWTGFLRLLNDERIYRAERSLKDMLGVADLKGKRFLDVGSGSGLFSLAARRLGAAVHSFDYDPSSVACTEELKKRFFTDDTDWIVEEASVLDRDYLDKLGQFDVVYSWGVLHHTGAMWEALDNILPRVKGGGGLLFIAIYNDQGWKSRAWWWIKYSCNRLPRRLRRPFAYLVGSFAHMANIVKYTMKLKPMVAIEPLLKYDKNYRGMSISHDMVDWIGGFPYEVASYSSLSSYVEKRGFELVRGKKVTTLGCSEMVFRTAN